MNSISIYRRGGVRCDADEATPLCLQERIFSGLDAYPVALCV